MGVNEVLRRRVLARRLLLGAPTSRPLFARAGGGLGDRGCCIIAANYYPESKTQEKVQSDQAKTATGGTAVRPVYITIGRI